MKYTLSCLLDRNRETCSNSELWNWVLCSTDPIMLLSYNVIYSFFYLVASPSMMALTVKFGVSPVASHSALTSELTREPMDLQLMVESWPVVMLPAEKAAETRQTESPDQSSEPRRLADTLKISACAMIGKICGRYTNISANSCTWREFSWKDLIRMWIIWCWPLTCLMDMSENNCFGKW